MEENKLKESIEDFKFEPVSKYDVLSKIAIVGKCMVGKTSLIEKAKEKEFQTEYKPTFGCEFSTLSAKINDFQLSFKIWDTSGHDKFQAQFKKYINNAALVILVYDVTNNESFKYLDYWLKIINEFPEVKNIILVGNKCDMEDKRQVSEEQGKEKCNSNKKITKFFECSALKNINVEIIFNEALKLLYLNYYKYGHGNLLEKNKKFEDDNTKKRGFFSCCWK